MLRTDLETRPLLSLSRARGELAALTFPQHLFFLRPLACRSFYYAKETGSGEESWRPDVPSTSIFSWAIGLPQLRRSEEVAQ